MGVQLNHLILDVDFFEKPKIKALRFRFGPLACLWVIEVLTQMSRASHASVCRDTLCAVGAECGIGADQIDDLIAYCSERGIIDRVEIGGVESFSNSRVRDDQAKLAEKQASWRDRQNKSRGSHERQVRDVSLSHASVTRDTGVTLNVHKCEHLNTEDLKIEDLKKEGGAGGEPPPVPPRDDPPARTIPLEFERYRPYVERYLPAPNPEQPAAWEHDTRWLNVGRKPLTRWPLLWLSDVELCQVFKIYEELVPDRAKRKKILEQAFAAAQADATTQLSAGKPLTTFNTFARITSWRLDEAIKTNISAERLEKLQGANGNLHQK